MKLDSKIKLGLLLKSLLNFFVFGLFLFFVPEFLFPKLGFPTNSFYFIRGVGIFALILGSIYFYATLSYPRHRTIVRIIFWDSVIYPITIVATGFLITLPFSVYLSALFVGIAGLILIFNKAWTIL